MLCHNCGNIDRFELSVELTAVAGAGGDLADPGLSIGLACRRCASTHVAGDPVTVLRRL